MSVSRKRTELSIFDTMKNVVIDVRVTGLRAFQIRSYFALLLIRLAGRLLGCTMNLEVEYGVRIP